MNYDDYAIQFIKNITECIQKSTENFVQVKSAIVDSVNDDGTVNIHFPLDDQVWSNISNQSIYQDIEAGDEVKIIEQNGVFKNCWIIGVHRAKEKQTILQNSNKNLDKLGTQVEKNVNLLQGNINELQNNRLSYIRDEGTGTVPTINASDYPLQMCIYTQKSGSNYTDTIYFSKRNSSTGYTWVKII